MQICNLQCCNSKFFCTICKLYANRHNKSENEIGFAKLRSQEFPIRFALMRIIFYKNIPLQERDMKLR